MYKILNEAGRIYCNIYSEMSVFIFVYGFFDGKRVIQNTRKLVSPTTLNAINWSNCTNMYIVHTYLPINWYILHKVRVQ